MVRKWGSSAEGSSTLSSRTEESSLVACSTATQRKKKKKSATASRDIRTALAVTGVHELMCGRPHCVGAFASRCVGASSCSALTALLHSSSGVNSTPSSLRREHCFMSNPLRYQRMFKLHGLFSAAAHEALIGGCELATSL